MVCGRKHVCIHTHLRNAVPLVWGEPASPPPKTSKYVPISRMHLRDIRYLYQDFIQKGGGLRFLPQKFDVTIASTAMYNRGYNTIIKYSLNIDLKCTIAKSDVSCPQICPEFP